MFVRYFVELPIEPRRVVSVLSRDPSSWLPGLARDAHRRGDTLLAEVGFGEPVRIEREVRVELGRPAGSTSKTVFPMRWEASAHPGLFPSLDADLEVAPLGTGRSQLAISARYVPPLRAIGRALDRAVLSRVAEATVKDFLDRVAASVMASPSRAVGPGTLRAAGS